LSTRPDRERLLQLNDVLVKACANDPNKRYGSAAEMHRDLTALKQGERPRKSRAKILLGRYHSWFFWSPQSDFG
jgi:hypothetical protein